METIETFPETLLQQYNENRLINIRRKLCHAPFQNLYFGRDGKVTACCYNRTVVLGQYPDQSLLEIWTGKVIQQFREEMTEHHFGTGCQSCAEQLEAGNFAGLHAKLYDRYADGPISGLYQKAAGLIKSSNRFKAINKELLFIISKIKVVINNRSFAKRVGHMIQQDFTKIFKRPATKLANQEITIAFPRALEFELSNICNLECTMCFGEFSSSIRKNREKLPPLPMYYDENFVRQLDIFLPHLWDAKFFGGEPFLLPIYFDIWERMIQLNPSTMIHITTNCTVLNEKVKRVLEKLNVILILSIDSLQKETYEAIRVNANYERVMENMKYFIKVAKEKQTILNMAVCPMTLNWQEIPSMVQYCNDKSIHIYFNTVWHPYELSLRSLPKENLKDIITFYDNIEWEVNNELEKYNIEVFQSYVNQIKKWHDYVESIEQSNFTKNQRLAERIEKFRQENSLFDALMENAEPIEEQCIDNQRIKQLAAQAESSEKFIHSYFETLCDAIQIYADKPDDLLLAIRKSNVHTLCENLLSQHLADEIIHCIIQNNHEHTTRYIIQMNFDAEQSLGAVFAPFTPATGEI